MSGASLAQGVEPKVADKAQYAACLDAHDAITRQSAAVASRNDELKAFAVRFQAADDSLNAQVRQHPPKTRAELASYNREVEKRNGTAKAFNERGKALEQANDALNAAVFNYNERCGALLVPMDLKAEVEAERRGGRAAP